ncbi:type II toxin-antitoxin system ParD family antitoxin [Aerosakkonema funiforme]|uniref:Type II toxin-antitoxin system ParD family antitoxin n=1 Tax=Aerosakkonema funiforme FACHB-1375 TaxID=2949571 RepID=A0A926ZG86_9CYAN|nr:type II toxin-antitoxin system ParD family antitoxin [Aerosakkonema funiforme]MBD2179526.1 type II toxin-antitoxin system ParD family antitoxin [Aerosakkonema funiforme FACHB-1375]
MNVSLTPELEKFVQEKVKSGRYLSASEVVREALRLLQEQDQIRQLRLEKLRKELMMGIEQLDRGEGVDGEKVFASLREKIRKARESEA